MHVSLQSLKEVNQSFNLIHMVREDVTNYPAPLLHPASFPCSFPCSFPLALILDVPAALFSGRLPTSWGCAANKKPTSFLTTHTQPRSCPPVILSPVSKPSLFFFRHYWHHPITEWISGCAFTQHERLTQGCDIQLVKKKKIPVYIQHK